MVGVKVTDKKLEAILVKARSSFFDFCQIIMKEDGYEFAPFHKFICDNTNE